MPVRKLEQNESLDEVGVENQKQDGEYRKQNVEHDDSESLARRSLVPLVEKMVGEGVDRDHQKAEGHAAFVDERFTSVQNQVLHRVNQKAHSSQHDERQERTEKEMLEDEGEISF